MEVKVGQYVRTIDGYIAKLVNKNDYLQTYYFDGYIWQRSYIPSNNISYNLLEKHIREDIKPSYDIIDMIEIGDYVNGVEVIGFEYDNDSKKYLQCGLGDYVVCTYYEEDIKTIVTKEKFKILECEVKKC